MTDEELKELRASQADTDNQIDKMCKKIDDLGEKFGGFTEAIR
jgi:peptidoglycan hydrolase CwlO-like protein